MELDHIALQVKDPTLAANWYKERFNATIIHCDRTWSYIQLDNVKIAFVVKSQHPPHIAFKVNKFNTLNKVKKHRDGSSSIYNKDPWGNIIEYIKYPEGEDGLYESEKKGVWRRIRGKLQDWRSCYVDRRIYYKHNKDKMRTFSGKRNKTSWWSPSLFC